MFRFINQKILDYCKRRVSTALGSTLNNSRGQVAVILILITAMALIFYAVTINLGELSQIKAVTTIAANTGASQLASFMASAGQYQTETWLGGKKKVCKTTSVIKILIYIFVLQIIIAIALVITIVSWGSLSWLGAFMIIAALVLLSAALTMQMVNLYMTVVVLDPLITKMWNKIQSRTLGLIDGALETGIHTGLDAVVTDGVMVPDITDFDTDGVFGFDPGTNKPRDYVPRYAVYYDRRIKSIDNQAMADKIKNIEKFNDVLKDFVYQKPFSDSREVSPNWGLHDPWQKTYNGGETDNCPSLSACCYIQSQPNRLIPAECNPCCMPLQIANPVKNPPPSDPALPDLDADLPAFVDVRPLCCDCNDPSIPETIPVPDPAWIRDPANPLVPPPMINVHNPHSCRTVFPPDPISGIVPPSVENWEPAKGGQCGTATKCWEQSPYGTFNPNTNRAFGFVYNSHYQNPENNFSPGGFRSFLELLGRDDENDKYNRDHTIVGGVSNINNIRQQLSSFGFIGTDASGYEKGLTAPFYGEPIGPPLGDRQTGIFSYLLKEKDWAMDLTQASTADISTNPGLCFWHDGDYGGLCSPPGTPDPYNEIGTKMSLPLSPVSLTYNTTNYVDSVNLNLVYPPLAVDKISYPANIFADPTQCAEDAFSPANIGNPVLGFWKMGLDRFCDNGDAWQMSSDPPGIYNPALTDWPYESGCTKHGTCTIEPATPDDPTTPGDDSFPAIMGDCPCSAAADPTPFNEDILDKLVYSIPDFIDWAEVMLKTNSLTFALTFPEWVASVRELVRPPDPLNPGDPGGELQQWLADITVMRDRFDQWKNGTSYAARDCGGSGGSDQAWCVPPYTPGIPLSKCPEISLVEQGVITAGSGGTYGNMNSVMACLNYNVDGFTNANKLGYLRLNICLLNCGACGPFWFPPAVPSAPYPSDPKVSPYVPPIDCTTWGPGNVWYDAVAKNLEAGINPPGVEDTAALNAMKGCLNNCNTTNCAVGTALPTGGAYTYPTNAFNASDCTPPTWGVGNTWYDNILSNIILASGNKGNAYSFDRCWETCSSADCNGTYNLPRSLLPIALYNPRTWFQAPILPVDEGAIPSFLNCIRDCNITNCSGLPNTRSDLSEYFPGRSFADPADWDWNTICATWTPLAKEVFSHLTVETINPSCLPANMDNTKRSAQEAVNQVAKFKQRRDFLKNRLYELKNGTPGNVGTGIIDILSEAETQFKNFLNDPAVVDLANLPADSPPDFLPDNAVYAWQSPPPERRNELATGGYWHIVRVEARMPGRCGIGSGNCGTNRLPWIKTKKKNFLTRCYELQDYNGWVKYRVTRFDQDRDSPVVRLANGESIWRFRMFSHKATSVNMAVNLGGLCQDYIEGNPPGFTIPDYPGKPLVGGDVELNKEVYARAFMIGEADTPGKTACKAKVDDLLSHGVYSETCAQYYYHGKMRRGMSFKFINCPQW